MVAQLRGEKFIEVTAKFQRERPASGYQLGEMVSTHVDSDNPHYGALEDVREWLGFGNFEDYVEALSTEREKIFERAK